MQFNDIGEAVRIVGKPIARVALANGMILTYNNGVWTATQALAGAKVYYVADSNGGATSRKLTFTDGILTSET